MPYKFTIVDERTLQPIAGWIEFRKGVGKTGRFPVPVAGIDFAGHEWFGFDTIAVGAQGFGEYSEPMDFEEGEYQFRLRKKVAVWPWVAGGIAAALLFSSPFFKGK